MDIDRKKICRIISEMLDNPDSVGIYPTAKAYDKLELYIERVRTEAVGYAFTKACVLLDESKDPRNQELSAIWEEAREALSKTYPSDTI